MAYSESLAARIRQMLKGRHGTTEKKMFGGVGFMLHGNMCVGKVLFPALHGIVRAHEYDSLGEDFEKKEQQLFGADGFEKMVDRIAAIEKSLGIYDLAQFTPRG